MSELEVLRRENARLHEAVSSLRAQLSGPASDKQNGVLSAAEHPAPSSAGGGCYGCATEGLPLAHQAVGVQPQGPRASCSNCTLEDSSRAFQQKYGLSKAQVERYSRHLLLPSFGIAAQGKLCSSSVLIIGCGGLGSPAALYLAAAGVGRLGLVDHDVVELSNMHRQVIHTEQRIGVHKAQSAAAAVQALNSDVWVETYQQGLRPSNAVDIISQYNVVIDASDNPPTRYLINDACVACGVPLVSAAAVGTDGQLTVYNHSCGPCYRCLFPECPAAANCSRCADAGVLGPVPGVLGVLQATEAIKLVTGVGQVLSSKLLLYDALAGSFTTIKLRGKAAGCIACCEGGVITRSSIAAYDYESFTGGQRPNDGPPAPLAVLTADQRITAQQLQDTLAAGAATAEAAAGSGHGSAHGSISSSDRLQQGPLLLDVRPAEQFAIMSVPGAVNVPYSQFDQRFAEVLQLCGTIQPADNPAAANGRFMAGGSATVNQAAAADAPDNSSNSGNESSSIVGGEQSGRVVYVMCRRGNHSQLAVERLYAAGVCSAVDVVGGYEAWAAHVDTGMPTL